MHDLHKASLELDQLIAFCQAIIDATGIVYTLDETEIIPESIYDRIIAELKGLVDTERAFNELIAPLQALQDCFLQDNERTVSLEQIVARLPKILALAPAGEAYIADLRSRAVQLYCAAKRKSQKAEMTAAEQQILDIIENCGDIPQLKAYIIEYGSQVEGLSDKRQSLRTSVAEEPPIDDGNLLTASDRRFEAATRLYESGGKGWCPPIKTSGQ